MCFSLVILVYKYVFSKPIWFIKLLTNETFEMHFKFDTFKAYHQRKSHV